MSTHTASTVLVLHQGVHMATIFPTRKGYKNHGDVGFEISLITNYSIKGYVCTGGLPNHHMVYKSGVCTGCFGSASVIMIVSHLLAVKLP
jgi:hypothetical protein